MASQQDRLTEEQIRQYFFDGCLLLPDFFSPDELSEIQSWTDELEELAEGIPTKDLFAATGIFKSLETAGGQKRVCRVEHFVPFHGGWTQLSKRIGAVVGQLFPDDQPAFLYKEKINFKRPQGRGYAPHYDGPSPAHMGLAKEFITAQVAIDEQTPENGCLLGVIPKNLYPDDLEETLIPPKEGADPEADGRAGAIRGEVAQDLPWQFLPAPAGSLLLFNHWFPHYSEGNKSDKVRRTAYLLFNAASEGDHHEAHSQRVAKAREQFASSPSSVAASQVDLDYQSDLLAIQRALPPSV
jgi:2-aminoethylphosphonate dioxygenase